MTNETARPFALHGGEKMIYDVRMGPMAMERDGVITVAYQANPKGAAGHPHVIQYDIAKKSWSAPAQIGEAPHYDHHFGPVIWFDKDGRLHALYNCHIRPGMSRHIVATEPGSIERWSEGPRIADSISYPHFVPIADGKLLLYYRVLGHLGYWAYRVSEDGGFTWSAARTVVDMDRDPEVEQDCWTGSYHSVAASPDGRSLHIAFINLDEIRRLNPLYNRKFTSCNTLNRYHLHYMKLDIATGELTTIDGEKMTAPVNRAQAERCKVWDGGWRLTNMPAIWVDSSGEPCFLLPISGKSPWECEFTFVRRNAGRWEMIPVAETNSTWSGCLLRGGREGRLVAYVVSGSEYGELYDYGGGDLVEWISTDDGSSWTRGRTLAPEPGLLYNNPRMVDLSTGGFMDDAVLFFGWAGPGSLNQTARRNPQAGGRGKAFLWRDGEYL
jgi:hypothetical protein